MRKQTGMTLSEYINNVRLDRAKEKLKHTDYNISEIALSCGFQNVILQQTFPRQIRHHPEIYPSQRIWNLKVNIEVV